MERSTAFEAPMVADESDLNVTASAFEESDDDFESPKSLTSTVSLSSAISTSSATTFTPFPKLPSEIRLRIWKLHLPIGSLKYVEVHRHEFMFAWDLKTQRWVINVPLPSLLHVNAESRYECLKHYIIMEPQPNHRSCAYYHLEKTALVFRDSFDIYEWSVFRDWLNQHIGELLRSFKHMVFEQELYRDDPTPKFSDPFPGNCGFVGVDWKRLGGLKSFSVAYLTGNIGEITGFKEDGDTDEHRRQQAVMLPELKSFPYWTTWNPETRVRFGELTFA